MGQVDISVLTAWAAVAQAAAESGERSYADGARVLLMILLEKGDLARAEFATPFGAAARALLAMAWSFDPPYPGLASSAIRFVARSFGTNAAASRALLKQVLDEPRFSLHAHEETPRLAESAKHMVVEDPVFVTLIYSALFGRDVPTEGESWLGGSPSRIMPLRSNRKAAAQLLEHSCHQLYFGSGTFKHGNDGEDPGLQSMDSMRNFLRDYEIILDRIGEAGLASSIYHLVELYEFLLSAAPELVFDKLAVLLVGPASRQGYQFESLAADVVVRMVRTYLSDYRGIFESSERRANLVAILEIFSDAGWPQALKLLYELPDLLR
jgi:hypothetical protein